MKTNVRYIGMDVHKESIVLAVAEADRQPVRVLATLPNDGPMLEKRLKKLGSPSALRLCYEAGPTGYGLARQLRAAGYDCLVAAPSLVPTTGRRVKTDRRDACKLAHFLRSGDLTAVTVPEKSTEAIRDLERAREDARRAERTARQQLHHFLLRHGRIWHEATRWTPKHLSWILQQQFEEPAAQRVLRDGLFAIELARDRVKNLTNDLQEVVAQWSGRSLVVALQALRGVQFITAVVLAAEIGDYQRFAHPRSLMGYLGLVPSEHTSGETRRQGRLTKTGNRYARRVLIEAAWNNRFSPRLTKAVARRQALTAPGVRAIANKASRRLHRRYRRLVVRGKPTPHVAAVLARELAGFVWAIAQEKELVMPE